MSSDVALQAMFDRFMGRFVLPLVSGDDSLLVSYPIGPGAELYFEGAQELEPGLSSDIIIARQQALAPLIPEPRPAMLRENEIRLLTGLHNILLCAHDELVGGMRGKARWDHTLGWAGTQIAGVPDCADAETALRRHSLLHLAPGLTREDVVLKTRRSSKRYAGQDPPKIAMIWPKLRQVSTNQSTVSLPDVIADDEARALFTEVLERSPLTCLLAMPYDRPDGVHQRNFSWTPELAKVLSHPALCRAVTYRHLELGIHKVGPILAKAFVEGIEQVASSRSPEDIYALAFGLRFIVNLQFTHIWSSERDELTAPLELRWGNELEGLRCLFYGWFAAALAREDRIGVPNPPSGELKEREAHFRRAAASVAAQQLDEAARHVDWVAPVAGVVAEQGGQS